MRLNLKIAICLGIFFVLGIISVLRGSDFYFRPRLILLEVIGDDRGTLSINSTRHYDSPNPGEVRGYINAVRNERFSIRVRNNSGKWLGIVLSVDGRNVVSGKRSGLGNNEAMYVLPPMSDGVWKGWRTGMSTVNRFYFTDEENSYAGSWGDYSEMGTIAVAAFSARRPVDEPRFLTMDGNERKKDVGKSGSAPSSDRSVISPRMAESQAGTGYGESHYSPTREVDFEPESFPAEKIVVKYGWGSDYPHPHPVFPMEKPEFAPPPPNYLD